MKHSFPFSNRRSFSLLLVIVLLALSGCGQTLVDDGSGFLKTSSGDLVSWPTGSKIKFLTDDSVPANLRKHIYLGQEDINTQINRVQVNVEVQGSNAPKIHHSIDDVVGDGVNGIYFLPEPWPWANTKGKENSDAMTVVINRGSTIVEADIFYRISTYANTVATPTSVKASGTRPNSETGMSTFVMNTEFAQEPLGTDERWTKVAFIHECLHALGFTHVTKERDSIMYPTVSNLLYDHPFSSGDLERLQRLY